MGEERKPRKRTYRVVGQHAVFDHPPGTEFERAIPPEQEATLIWGGAIKRVEKDGPSKHR